MDATTTERQKLIDKVNTLPEEALFELSNFLDYLRYKSVQQSSLEPKSNASGFLAAIAGIGSSGQQDIAERDEEILSTEKFL